MNYETNNIRINRIEIYYPESTIDVNEIIKEHKKYDDDIESEVKDFFGRKNLRRSKDNKENSLTMSINASKKVLKSSNLTGKDIDIIAFATATPEYLSPPSSVLIHEAIKGKTSTICYDINLNCVGMLFSFIQISSQMKADSKLNRVLLVGCDTFPIHIPRKGAIDACMGEVACAIILEKTSESSDIIDYTYYVNPHNSLQEIAFPGCGLSHVYDSENTNYRKVSFGNPHTEINIILDRINYMIKSKNLKADDISLFCFSQFSLYCVEYLRNNLSIDSSKALYIGDKFGYTGTTSPFLALYFGLKNNKIKRGDYVFFWSVGTGNQNVFILIKY